MKELIALPFLTIVLILQTAIASRTPLLGGYADLFLLTLAAWALQKETTTAWHWAIIAGVFVGFTSGLPWIIPVLSYLLVVVFARILVHRVWQAPLLAMFSIIFLGTLSTHLLSVLTLTLSGAPIVWSDALGLVTLPSLLLNLLLAIPAYPIMRDLARWMYGIEDEA